nr:nuclear transport factor 2 family protein [Fredinandcohnia sp. SECRCQ15]
MEFTKMHDVYITDWNDAMSSGDSSALESIMAEDYYVTFFHSTNDKPAIFDAQESISGMQQSIKELLGASKKFENRVIRLKNPDTAVVFFELLIEKEEKVLARLFTIETWQLRQDKWMLVKETVEPIN